MAKEEVVVYKFIETDKEHNIILPNDFNRKSQDVPDYVCDAVGSYISVEEGFYFDEVLCERD